MTKKALNKKQVEILKKLGLPTDFSQLDYEELDRIDDAVYHEMVMHGVNDAGDGLTEYGELCRGILNYLADF